MDIVHIQKKVMCKTLQQGKLNDKLKSFLLSIFLEKIILPFCHFPREVLHISSDGDDRRIFWRLKFFGGHEENLASIFWVA